MLPNLGLAIVGQAAIVHGGCTQEEALQQELKVKEAEHLAACAALETLIDNHEELDSEWEQVSCCCTRVGLQPQRRN